MSESYIEESKKHWWRSGGAVATNEDLKLGCLQRIATATEVMAKEHQRLLDRVKWLEQDKARLQERRDYLERSNAALRGHLKRAKAQLPKDEKSC